MRLFIIATAMSIATAFAPTPAFKTKVVVSPTELAVSRRDVILTGLLTAAAPMAANAKQKRAMGASTTFFDDSLVNEPAQQHTGDKLDINSAFVDEYKAFPGFFPHAAGQIASNGPYKSVKDIYKIDGLTENDKAVFKKYEGELSVNPPGRAFDERLNARMST